MCIIDAGFTSSDTQFHETVVNHILFYVTCALTRIPNFLSSNDHSKIPSFIRVVSFVAVNLLNVRVEISIFYTVASLNRNLAILNRIQNFSPGLMCLMEICGNTHFIDSFGIEMINPIFKYGVGVDRRVFEFLFSFVVNVFFAWINYKSFYSPVSFHDSVFSFG